MKFLDIVSSKIFDFRLIENCNKMFIIFKIMCKFNNFWVIWWLFL